MDKEATEWPTRKLKPDRPAPEQKPLELWIADCEWLEQIVFDEVGHAERKFPDWPVDVVHAAGIVVEEAGEAMQAALDYAYGRQTTVGPLSRELVQTAAMCFRALVALKRGHHDGTTSTTRTTSNEQRILEEGDGTGS